jgi:RNA polymerase sigma-70 factor (ECF subfamily)
MDRLEVFNEHRKLLMATAYRMLGSAADAEDVVQEAFLRWQRAPEEEIRSARAYLTTIVTRLCLDQLRSARAQREQYVGPWLPEPVITGPGSFAPDPEDAAVLSDSLSMAFLVLLESLAPAERVAFLLREVFEYEYAEVAEALGKSEEACRQLVSRARARIAARRPRFEASREERERLTSGFMQACATGDMEALLGVLAPDVTFYSDGGGKVPAAINPVGGADRVGRLILGLLAKAPPSYTAVPTEINGEPGYVMYVDGKPDGAVTLHIEGGRIADIYVVRNPDKLRKMPPLQAQ